MVPRRLALGECRPQAQLELWEFRRRIDTWVDMSNGVG
jgi:hypothetical protein